jgi:CRISPR/Cas system-associated exonuclease Cas4 (RecB family)
LLEELFNPEQPFDQTTNPENCKYCPYKRICYR